MIDLLKLNYCDKIIIDEEIDIPKEYLKNVDIVSLSKIKVNGEIVLDVENNYVANFDVFGTMKLHDSITYDLVDYPFTINIEENLENDKNTIDIIPILWQNIVLEVPLRFTKVSDYSKYQGDGWKLVSEEDLVNNNPFNTLLKDEDRSD